MLKIPVSLHISGVSSSCGDIVICALAFPHDLIYDYEMSSYVRYGLRITEAYMPDILRQLADVEAYVMFEHISPEMLNDAESDEIAVYKASELLLARFLATYEIDPPHIWLFRKEMQGSIYYPTELISLSKNISEENVFYHRAHWNFGSVLVKARRLKHLSMIANQYPKYKLIDHRGLGWIAREEVLLYGPNLKIHHVRDVWAIQKTWYMNLGMHRLTRNLPRILIGRWDLYPPDWWSKYFDSPFGSQLDKSQMKRVIDGIELITGNREEKPPQRWGIKLGEVVRKEDLAKITDDYKLEQLEKDNRLANLRYLKRRSNRRIRQMKKSIRRELLKLGIPASNKSLERLKQSSVSRYKLLIIREEIINEAKEAGILNDG